MKDPEWLGVLDEEVLNKNFVADSNRLADAAKAGEWDRVFALIDGPGWVGANTWRVSGKSWFAPLHQAAWYGAPASVVERLLTLGAWRSLRSADGKRAVDIAIERGHNHLADVLAPKEVPGYEAKKFPAWDEHLQALVAERTRSLEAVRIRPVPTEIIVAENLEVLRFAYPGMYGGFALSVHRGRLCVDSWSRVVGGSGQAHVITEGGCVLIEEGFV